MDFTYLKLYAANGKCESSFCDMNKELYKGESIFDRACEYVNRSGNFLRYGRKMEIIYIESNCITVKLYSKEKLKMPSKSMSGFTRELLRMDKELYPDEEYHIFGLCMLKDTLFKYQEVNNLQEDTNCWLDFMLGSDVEESSEHIVSEEELKEQQYRQISDIDALKLCVDLFSGNTSMLKSAAGETEEIKGKIKVLLRQAVYTCSEYEEERKKQYYLFDECKW